ncbi:bifunctional metallophosphatase/5'-nucleotidase [Palleronia sp. KMU-117]|uniref:bifunctional metallophosphatase/5'-nucleotidase n=1 Tax=Palleronia sp. KMU-117 TaxID=3434108 RepID=UPI003D740B69
MTARLLCGAAFTALMATQASADYTLHVLHINDMHSRIEPINAFGSTCSADDKAENKCFGGVARLYTKINELRDALTAAGENVIVLDAGDQFQGSLMYTTYKGAAEAEFMNAIGFDAMAVGNHEFDDGPEKLAEFVDVVEFPVISGNLDLSQSNLLNGKVDNHVVLEVGGEKIGIISALATDTVETSSPGPNVIFQDEIDSLAADVATLQAEGVTKIIALTHVGLPKDIDIAGAVAGVDAVVGGHSHTYLSSSDPARQGAYPTWVSQGDGTLVPVVQAGAYSKYLGHLELTFDDAGNLVYAAGDTIVLDASVEENPEIAARVAELGGPIEELKAQVVGTAAEMIEGDRTVCRAVECPMGNLVADAMLDRVRDQGVTIAIQNGGGLRASIDAGEITMGEVLTVLPFQNTLATFEATGQMIIDALENGVSQVEDGAGRFPQVAGLKYSWKASNEPGSRILDVMVADGDGWVPIDPATVYGVVTNDYMRNGGDGYRMFREGMNPYDFGPGLEMVLADYIAAMGGTYTPYIDGRIVRVE